MKYLVSIIILFFNFTFINCQNWYWLIKTNKKVYQFLTDNCSNSADWNYCTYQGCPSSDSVINYLSSSNPSRGEYKFSHWNFPTLIDFDNSTNLNDDCYQKLAVVSTPAATYQNNNSIIFLKKDNNIQWYYYGFNNDYNYTLNESIKLTNIEFTNTDSLLSETLVLELYASTVFIDSIEIQKNNINTYNEYTFSLNNFLENRVMLILTLYIHLKYFIKLKAMLLM